jgi:hypothetical protein
MSQRANFVEPGKQLAGETCKRIQSLYPDLPQRTNCKHLGVDTLYKYPIVPIIVAIVKSS